MNIDDLLEASGNNNINIDSDIVNFIPTGSYILNALISGSIFGGIPSNKIIALAGESSTGKTFYATSICKNFLDLNKDGVVFYFDSESAVTPSLLKSKGIDNNRFKVLPISTIEEFRNQVNKVLDKYCETPEESRLPLIMVLDSLGMLSTNKEVKDVDANKDVKDFTKPGLIRGTFRTLTIKLAQANIPLIVTNHTYATVGSMFPTQEMSGGSGLKYAASVIVALSKRQEKENSEVVGNVIKCKLLKSRITKEKKEVETRLFYDERGLDQYYGLLQLAEKYDLVKKVGNRYEINGKKMYEKNILENPDDYFDSDFMEQLEQCAIKEFKYGE